MYASKTFEGRSPSVLIVDDDPLVAKAMGTLIGRAGFNPIVCTSAADALEQADENVAVAVVDIHLPDLNGLELSQRLRDVMGADAPIIILSGDNSMETIRALPEAGATHFFSKPVNATALVEHLRQWVGK
jgi:DNA-binding response OmpR family regulator